MLDDLGVSYRWVGSCVDPNLVGPHCLGVQQQVPYDQMPHVYGTVDILVKASNSEGMFGPPLEMFATGGTAIAWHVQGAEEYMSDRYNSYLVPMNSWPRMRDAIREMADNPRIVEGLQENALATAEAWPTWEDQADQIIKTVESLAPFDRHSLIRQVAKNQYHTVVQDQHQAIAVREAVAAALRPLQAEVAALRPLQTELAALQASRSMKLVRTIKHVREVVAPDHSLRWGMIRNVGRIARRAGRLLGSIRRAA
jgi:hypothetical protein